MDLDIVWSTICDKKSKINIFGLGKNKKIKKNKNPTQINE